MAVVQSAVGTLSGGNLVATFGSNVTNGNTILAFITAGNANVNTITDTRSVSYTQKESVDDSGTSGERIHAYYGVLASGGANTVTVTPSGTFTDGAMIVVELSGRASGDVIGTRHANNTQAAPGTSANAVTCGPVTALTGDDFILCTIDVGALQTGNYTAGTGFTEVAESGDGASILDMAVYKKENVSSGSQSATATSANNDRTISILFSVASAGGSDSTQQPTGLSMTASVGTPTVLRSGVQMSPTGFGMTSSLGTPSITSNAITIAPTGFGLTSSLGTPSLSTTGSVTQNPPGFGMTASLGSAQALSNAIAMQPTGMVLTTTLGSFIVENDITLIGVSLAAMTASLGTPTVLKQTDPTVAPTGMSMTASLGAPVVSQSVVNLSPAGLSMTASVGTVAVQTGNTQSPTGLSMTASLGTPTVNSSSTSNVVVTPAGMGMTASLGTVTIVRSGIAMTPTGFGMVATLGFASVLHPSGGSSARRPGRRGMVRR